MIRLRTRATTRRCRVASRETRGGFTLIELLVVIVVLAILVALLLPAINSAIRTAKNAAVSAEINQLAQALESFKSKYGDYPPSRFLAVENGNYSAFLGDTTNLHNGTLMDPTSPGTGDITLGQLAQRSVSALRKFFPRVSTTGLPSGVWYDFNGNGGNGPDSPYILHGHECLVFFLGGVPLLDANTGVFGLTGFGKDPTNPFTNSIVGHTMYNANRQPPFFEFNSGRLFADPHGTSNIPGYYDSLGNSPPTALPTTINFYAYFSSYGSGHYDPNDVNLFYPLASPYAYEVDFNSNGPIGLQFQSNYPVVGGGFIVSPSPNPYTSTLTANNPTGALPSGTVTYQKPQTFQIISSGLDGLYGVGGQFQPTTTSATIPLPFDSHNSIDVGNSVVADSDATLRQREYDNLTNFKSGRLQ